MLKKRILSVFLCFCIIIGMLPVITPKAQAYTTGDDYPYKYEKCGTGTIDTIDPWNFFYRECTSFVAYCLRTRNGVDFHNRHTVYNGTYYPLDESTKWGHAYHWAETARFIGIPVDMNPAVGAVAWCDAYAHGSAATGHVAWVSAVNGDYVTLEEYRKPTEENGWTDYIYNTRTILKSQVSGYIHINDITAQSAYYAYTQDLGADFYAYIRNPQSGCNLENRNGNVQLTSINTSDPRQIWHFTRQDEASYKITNMYDGRCLDTNGPEGGSSVDVLPYNGSELQKWRFYGLNNEGPFYVSPYRYNSDSGEYKAHAYVLDAQGGGTTPGTNIQLYANGYKEHNCFIPAQTFQVNKISQDEVSRLLASNPGGNFYSRIKFNDTYLQTTGEIVPDGNYFGMNVATTRNQSNDPHQIWHFIRQNDGSYKIVNEYNDWCLDLRSGIPGNGKNIWTWSDDHGENSERWYLVRSPSDSTYRIASALKYPSELYSIDINLSEGINNGYNAQLYQQNEGMYQQFSIAGISYTRPKPSAPMNIKVNATSFGTTITWDATPAVGTFDSRAYQVYLASVSENKVIIPQTIVTENSYSSSTVLPDGDYQVVLQSINTKYFNLRSTSQYYDFSVTSEPVTCTVKTEATKGGTASGSGVYQVGTSATVTAVPSDGYHFIRWTENGSPVSATNPYTFTATANRTLTAVFEQKQGVQQPTTYFISVNASPAAGGTVTGNGTYEAGNSVTVTATAATGYEFRGWTENGSQVSASASYTFNINANHVFTAVFEKKITPSKPLSYNVDVSASPNAGGTIIGGGTFAENTSTTVTASANSGYKFVRWMEGGISVGTSASYSFTVRANRTLVAVFEKLGTSTLPSPKTYVIGTSATPVAGGTVTGGGNYEENTSVTVTAAANNGYRFDGWMENGNQVSTNATYTFTASADRNLDARFSSITSKPGDSSNSNNNTSTSGESNTGSSTVTNYPIVLPNNGKVNGGGIFASSETTSKGNVVTITTTPDTGYELVSVVALDGSGRTITLLDKGNGKYAFTMPDSKVTVNAVFQLVRANEPENAWNNPFTDISEGKWYYEAVRFVQENHLMNGNGNNTFAPDANLSRAMLAQILYNKEERPPVTGSAFIDVDSDTWYSKAVTWAAERGIVSGYGNGLFGPDDNITREQLAVMLWRYAGEPVATNKELHFSDAGVASDYAVNALCWAVENGIINGKGNGILDPRGLATRAQVAQMLMNYLKK